MDHTSRKHVFQTRIIRKNRMLAQEEGSISELQEGTKISECFLSHVTLK